MKWKSLYRLCAIILALASLTIITFAASSVEDQMAANSAAWYIAKANGDEVTCAALHAANESLAKQAAGSSGSASYDSSSGTWDITTSSGSRITSSSSSSGGKSTDITYTSTDSSGRTSSTTSRTYADDSINAYLGSGGTKQGLQDSYNKSADRVTTSHDYGDLSITTSAADEAAVAKALLGLTDAEAKKLENELEAAKQAYESADADYKEALARGDSAAAEAAKAMMDAAHEDSQSIRESYGYTGDTSDITNGGYYYDAYGRKVYTSSDDGGGGFYYKDKGRRFYIEASCNKGGTVEPMGRIRVDQGSSMAFSFAPNSGNEVKKVVVDGVEKPATKSYAFANVQSDHTLYVEFGKALPKITASAGEGGMISPNGEIAVEYNTDKSFTITPNDGYNIKDVIVDDVSQGAITSYTFRYVRSAHTIRSEFEKKTNVISASVSAGGKVETSGPAGKQTVTGSADIPVPYGETQSFSILPDAGYSVASVTVDGVNKGTIPSYTFSSVKEPHSISVEFVKQTNIIKASVGAGGKMETTTPSGKQTISASANISVPYGDSQTFTIQPDPDHSISNVVVDGVSKGAIMSYTFSGVKEAHTISVTFEAVGKLKIGKIKLTDALGANIGKDGMKSGYGFMVKVPVEAVNVTNVKVKLKYNFGSGEKSVTLQKSGAEYVCPVNADSPTGARCVYVPVETPDADYTLTVEVTAKNAAGTTLSDTATAKLKILGVMYEDDFTGDS